MFAQSNIKPLMNCNLGLSVHTKFCLKKKNIIGRVKTTVKKYLAQVICSTGSSALKYFANPSIIGSITHAKRLKVIAFMNLKDLIFYLSMNFDIKFYVKNNFILQINKSKK